MKSRQQQIYGLVCSLFFMSLVMGCDLFFELFCARIPLVLYLVTGALGAVFGVKFSGWLSVGGWGRKALRALAILGCGMGLLGAGALTFFQPPWGAHCGFRYCGRVMGLGLFQSPFPVGTPSCRDLHMCANEFPFTERARRDFYDLISTRGCEMP